MGHPWPCLSWREQPPYQIRGPHVSTVEGYGSHDPRVQLPTGGILPPRLGRPAKAQHRPFYFGSQTAPKSSIDGHGRDLDADGNPSCRYVGPARRCVFPRPWKELASDLCLWSTTSSPSCRIRRAGLESGSYRVQENINLVGACDHHWTIIVWQILGSL